MATTFDVKGNSNARGSNLRSQIDVIGGQASGDTYADVADSLDRANDLINKNQIQKNTIIDTFPGYLPDQFQKNITDSQYRVVYAEQGWDTQKYMTFIISPGSGRRYNPSHAKIYFKANIEKTDGTALGDNALPVENFYAKLFKKIEITNLNTGTLVNKNIEYNSDLFDLMSNWYYDGADYKHVENTRNQKLVQTVGRRVTAANNTNERLEKRFSDNEQKKWAAKTMFDIDLAKVHSFFGINTLMWVPLEMKFYLNDDYRQLFEIKPAADVDAADIYKTEYTIKYDNSFPPQIIMPEFSMSPSYQQQDAELFSQNGIYDLGNYVKPYKRIQTISLGADQATIPITGITERPEWLIIQMQSLTSLEHQTHYDSTHEDLALNLIKRVVISGLETVDGVKEIDFEVNNPNKIVDQLTAYNALRRFTTNAPTFATNTALRETNYLGNFLTESEFMYGATKKDKGCFPLVFDLSDSKGTYDGASDDNSYLSPKIQCSIYLNNATITTYNILLTVVTTGKYALSMNDNGQPVIIKV